MGNQLGGVLCLFVVVVVVVVFFFFFWLFFNGRLSELCLEEGSGGGWPQNAARFS
jgi:hypothetical protein